MIKRAICLLLCLFLATALYAETRNIRAAVIKNSDGNVVGFVCEGSRYFLGVYDKRGKGKGFIGSGQTKLIVSEQGDRYFLMPGKVPLNLEAAQSKALVY